MEYMLLFVVVLELVYIVFKDMAFEKERERAFLKIMSRDVVEYKESIEVLPEEEKKEEEHIFVPAEQASVEDILKAKDNT